MTSLNKEIWNTNLKMIHKITQELEKKMKASAVTRKKDEIGRVRKKEIVSRGGDSTLLGRWENKW